MPGKILGDAGVWAFVQPASISERYELAYAYLFAGEPGPRQRAFVASLALCWPDLRAHLAAAGIRYTGDVLEYGRSAFDELTGPQNADRDDVLEAGREAWQKVYADLKPLMEAKRNAKVFSRGGSLGPSSASSSPSNDSTTSPPEASEPSPPTA